VIRRVLFLIGGVGAAWLLLALPFRMLSADPGQGEAAVAYSGAAALLCLLPSAITLFWGARALQQSHDQQLIMLLGGTGVRLFTVLPAGFALFQWVPYFQAYPGFWIWLGVFYLVTLALETALLLGAARRQPAGGRPTDNRKVS
jgi:hypothetical protein